MPPESPQGQNYLYLVLRTIMPFFTRILSLSAGEFSRGCAVCDDTVALEALACVPVCSVV